MRAACPPRHAFQRMMNAAYRRDLLLRCRRLIVSPLRHDVDAAARHEYAAAISARCPLLLICPPRPWRAHAARCASRAQTPICCRARARAACCCAQHADAVILRAACHDTRRLRDAMLCVCYSVADTLPRPCCLYFMPSRARYALFDALPMAPRRSAQRVESSYAANNTLATQ